MSAWIGAAQLAAPPNTPASNASNVVACRPVRQVRVPSCVCAVISRFSLLSHLRHLRHLDNSGQQESRSQHSGIKVCTLTRFVWNVCALTG
ncbi:Uncharacterised protein [Mycobacterium tuberculosis]|nr:Uncharacterised protein [Mycobacterium tuberculosis]